MSLTRDFTPYDSREVVRRDPVRRAFPKSWGAEYVGEGRVVFRLWAPDLDRVRLQIDGRVREMLPAGGGWFTLTVEGIGPDTPYHYLMPDGRAFADPASRAQRGGVSGPSLVVDPAAYRWSVPSFRGHAWEQAVIYEMHVGAFTEGGTFRSAIPHLASLAEFGITMVQLMPVGQFPGARGWGYDGVLPYAPHHAYGSPEDMKAFVDAAHRAGLSVLLDVVYNHFGPEGSLLEPYVPSFFEPGLSTPWGPAISFSQTPVRAFFIENALYWLEEYNLDGLRLDAVDQIFDDGSEVHFLTELAARVRSDTRGRRRHLVMEDHRNTDIHLTRSSPAHYEAVWNHDLHHAAHVVATGETVGYVAPFAEDAVAKLEDGFAKGFILTARPDDDLSRLPPPRDKDAALPPQAFIHFLQNHDQVGNRARGERLATLAEAPLLRVLEAMLILSPQIPMLFMGEEHGETGSFRFFCDYQGDLALAAWENRIAEAREFGGVPDSVRAPRDLPDPNDVEALVASRLHRLVSDEVQEAARRRLKLLLEKRRAHVVPLLSGDFFGEATRHDTGADGRSGNGIIAVDWIFADRRLELRAVLPPGDGSDTRTAKQAMSNVPGVRGTIFHVETGAEMDGETDDAARFHPIAARPGEPAGMRRIALSAPAMVMAVGPA